MEIEEIVKILIAIVVLLILIGGVLFLFKDKGFSVLEAIKNLLRFGG